MNIKTGNKCNIIIEDNTQINNNVVIFVAQYKDQCSQVYIKEDEDDTEIKFNFSVDGYYKIAKFQISTLITDPIYYKDYKFYDELGEEIELQNLVNEYGEIYHYFNLCNLKKCYFDFCQEFLDKYGYEHCSNINRNDLQKRDLIQIGINTIEYLVDQERYTEAQDVLDRIQGCNGLCNNIKKDCGCV